MELHELHVGDRDTGAERHRDAVAGRQRRVRRHREALAGAAGRDRRVPGADLVRDGVGIERPDADGTAVLDEQVDREPALADLGGRRLDRSHEGALDLGTGRVAAGVDDPRNGVAALAGERETLVGLDRSAHPSR